MRRAAGCVPLHASGAQPAARRIPKAMLGGAGLCGPSRTFRACRNFLRGRVDTGRASVPGSNQGGASLSKTPSVTTSAWSAMVLTLALFLMIMNGSFRDSGRKSSLCRSGCRSASWRSITTTSSPTNPCSMSRIALRAIPAAQRTMQVSFLLKKCPPISNSVALAPPPSAILRPSGGPGAQGSRGGGPGLGTSVSPISRCVGLRSLCHVCHCPG